VTELFPISSLGHTVIYPSLFGWHDLVVSESQPESHWLGFVVMLHVGSALGILVFFWRDWVLIIRAWLRTLARRRVETPTEKLSWLIIPSSIPAGLLGLAFEHQLRVLLAKPALAAIFLMVKLGMVFAALGALVSVRWLVRWFRTGTLVPFAVYCLGFGLAMTIYFNVS
jgi:undecaprenyl-diphosphatase